LLMQQCAGAVKKLSLELGSNRLSCSTPISRWRPRACPWRRRGGAIASKYRNAGQTCVCANRILV
jgi:succinate-semialdehyde dehydrogenase / glutarate-semialdehyde dehydrogenase